MLIDWDKHLFRCSGLAPFMGYSERTTLPDGAKTACKKLHREKRWNRRATVKIKYFDKGNIREEDSITLLSLHTKQFLKKNDERLNNAYLTGEPDLYKGVSIRKADEGWDTKTSWDWETFPYDLDDLKIQYDWQDLGYMALTGAKVWHTVHCLVNTPVHLIDDEKRRLLYKMNVSEWSPEYIEACKDIERRHIYDMAYFKKENPGYDLAIKPEEWNHDIPAEERLIFHTVQRNVDKIQLIYNRIDLCRDYLKTLS